MSKIDTLAKQLASLIKNADTGTKPYDTPATVTRIDGGTAWVHLQGGVDETPVALTINAQVGDTVQVRVSGGRAWILGNATAPPTDDATAKVAQDTARAAQAAADASQGDIDNLQEWFWHDTNGSHVLGATSGYRNDIKSTGMSIVETATEEIVAEFGANGAQIGESGTAHITMTPTALQEYGSDGTTKYFEVGEAKNAGTFTYTAINAAVTSQTYTYTLPSTPTSGTPIYFWAQFKERVYYPGGSSITTYKTTKKVVVFTYGSAAGYTWSDAPFGINYDGNRTITLRMTSAELVSLIPTTVLGVEYTTSTTGLEGPVYTLGTRGTWWGQAALGGDKSLAVGTENIVQGNNAAAFGEGLQVYNDNEVAVGTYNTPDLSGERLFSIGRGEDRFTPDDALSVTKDGEVSLYVNPSSDDTTTVDYKLLSALTALGWTDVLS